MKKRSLYFALGCWLLATGGLVTSCDGYDLMDEDPSWLGSSIYNYLQTEGKYNTTLNLIRDLGYSDVLAKTGSKTLFVADDDAFKRFFSKDNEFNVSSYEQLTTEQKKLLLFGSMINNACQVAYLSSVEGPVEGECMRRITSISAYDNVPILNPSEMPNTPYWQYYKDNGKSIPCFQDITSAPMIHFIEDFLSNSLITNDDVTFLQNGQVRNPGDANVNGVVMEQQNIKCSNGFIHKMKEVIIPLPNMAQIINESSEMTEYAKLLNRFCAPYYAGDYATSEYNRLYNTNYDSVFQKRYFSERSQDGEALVLTPGNGPVNGTLKFDPGWNQFYSQTSEPDAHVALQQNMGVMLVPTNEALNRYWNEGAGKVLKDYYGTWENVPDKVVSKMLNVNMLNSFVNSVPSKFETVLNDANDEMGLDTAYIDKVVMGCNGAIYLTNRVFNPVAYVSVHFPALVDETMSVFYWGIEQLGFDVYLNSQNSYYSLFIPDNEASLNYIDPCSYGKVSTQLFRFHYKPTAQTEREKVWASIWNYNTETGEVLDSIGEATYDQIVDRLEDILDYHIIVGDVEDGNTYYKSKGGGIIKVDRVSEGEGRMRVYGSLQADKGTPVIVQKIYDESVEGNGKTYILQSEPLMTTEKAVSDILQEHREFDEFWKLLQGSSLLETKHIIGTDQHGCASTNINLFNTFNYTVYVPTNESILKLQADGTLPTWDDVAEAETDEEADSLTNEIELFLKYHIQDNSLFIGQGTSDANYETSAYRVEDENLLYYKVKTYASNDGITIYDQSGGESHVTKQPGLYNLMAREYQYDSSDASRAQTLYTSSYAVVHQIDRPLNYKEGGTE